MNAETRDMRAGGEPHHVGKPLELTEILRNAARALLVHAVEAEVAGSLSKHADKAG